MTARLPASRLLALVPAANEYHLCLGLQCWIAHIVVLASRSLLIELGSANNEMLLHPPEKVQDSDKAGDNCNQHRVVSHVTQPMVNLTRLHWNRAGRRDVLDLSATPSSDVQGGTARL